MSPKPQPPLQLLAGPCPGNCGRTIPATKFLCNRCASAVGDTEVIRLATAVDAGDSAAFTAAMAGAPALVASAPVGV